MTIDEVNRKYQIPKKILKEYESWGLCGAVRKVMGNWQYDDQDLERLSLIMTLHDIGFRSEEVETYMHLVIEGDETQDERMRILDQKREKALDEIHFREKQLDRMDYLRYEIRKCQNKQKKPGRQ